MKKQQHTLNIGSDSK